MKSYHEMMCDAFNECKKEIDKYFELKVKQYEESLAQFNEDSYPEEIYVGISDPSVYFMYGVEKKWEVLLFNRKLMEYKPAYVFRGQEFFDEEHSLPVSKGWEYYCKSGIDSDHIKLSCFHAMKAKELKLNWKEYNEKYLTNNGETR